VCLLFLIITFGCNKHLQPKEALLAQNQNGNSQKNETLDERSKNFDLKSNNKLSTKPDTIFEQGWMKIGNPNDKFSSMWWGTQTNDGYKSSHNYFEFYLKEPITAKDEGFEQKALKFVFPYIDFNVEIDEYVYRNKIQDPKEVSKYVKLFDLYHKNIQVHGYSIAITVENEKVIKFHGKYEPNLNVEINNPINATEAYELSKKYIELKHSTDSTLLEFPKQADYVMGIYQIDVAYPYVYKFNISAKEKWLEKEAYLMGYGYYLYVNAITGEILRADDMMLY